MTSVAHFPVILVILKASETITDRKLISICIYFLIVIARYSEGVIPVFCLNTFAKLPL